MRRPSRHRGHPSIQTSSTSKCLTSQVSLLFLLSSLSLLFHCHCHSYSHSLIKLYIILNGLCDGYHIITVRTACVLALTYIKWVSLVVIYCMRLSTNTCRLSHFLLPPSLSPRSSLSPRPSLLLSPPLLVLLPLSGTPSRPMRAAPRRPTYKVL